MGSPPLLVTHSFRPSISHTTPQHPSNIQELPSRTTSLSSTNRAKSIRNHRTSTTKPKQHPITQNGQRQKTLPPHQTPHHHHHHESHSTLSPHRRHHNHHHHQRPNPRNPNSPPLTPRLLPPRPPAPQHSTCPNDRARLDKITAPLFLGAPAAETEVVLATILSGGKAEEEKGKGKGRRCWWAERERCWWVR